VGLEHLKQESMQSRGVVTSGHKLCHWPTFSPWATGIARPHQHPTTLHAPCASQSRSERPKTDEGGAQHLCVGELG
jgi:hypothetical protein